VVYPVKMVQKDEMISTPLHDVDGPYREGAEGSPRLCVFGPRWVEHSMTSRLKLSGKLDAPPSG
jgi:hypothetical protein